MCDGEGDRSDTLWAALLRLWLQPLSCYVQIVVVEVSLQWHRYIHITAICDEGSDGLTLCEHLSLIRLWLHLLSCYVQTVILEVSLQFHGLLYAYTSHFELMKSVCSHGSLSMLFVMQKVMVWHFESNSHKVMTAFSVMLASNWCSGGFSAIS
jgi:hypothetical protein